MTDDIMTTLKYAKERYEDRLSAISKEAEELSYPGAFYKGIAEAYKQIIADLNRWIGE